MSVLIKTGLDTQGATQDAAKLQSSLKGEIGSALQSVQTKADEAQKSLKGLLDIQKVQVAVSALGPLKSIVDGVGVSVLGLSEATAKAASKSLDMASQGAAIGQAFGPVGAIIGGVGGALLGYVSSADNAAEAQARLNAQLAETKRQADITIESYLKLQAASNQTQQGAQTLSAQYDKLAQGINQLLSPEKLPTSTKAIKEEIDKLTKGLKDGSETAAQYSEQIKALSKEAESLKDKAVKGSAGQVEAEERLSAINKELAQDQALLSRATDLAATDAARYTALQNALAQKTGEVSKALAAQAKAQKDLVVGVAGPTITTQADVYRKAAADKIQADAEAFAKEEEIRKNIAIGDQQYRERLGQLSMQAAAEAIEQQKQAMETIAAEAEASAARIGAAFHSAFIDIGVGAANTFFDNIEAGRKPIEGLGNAFAKLASQQLRSIGTTLIGEGLQNELKAASLLILSAGVNPQGYALAGVGAAEIAAGLAMGGAGALLGRRANKGASTSTAPTTGTSESLGSREAEAKGPQQLAPVKIYLGPEQGMAVFAGDQRGLSEYGRFTTQAQVLSSKAPR